MSFPNKFDWSFDEMMAADHRRGVTLEADGSPSSLLMRVCGALEKSLEVGKFALRASVQKGSRMTIAL